MSGIFISYRRSDSAGHAGRLFDRLKELFGAEQVFMDVEGIAPGADFVQAIEHAVQRSDVVLAVIGAQWLDCKDEQGRRRIDDPEDFVRLEIISGLKHNKKVIPMLVQEAEMPSGDDLPPALAEFAKRQAVELSDNRWDSDVAKLAHAIQTVVPNLQRVSKPRKPTWWLAAAAMVLLVVSAIWWQKRPPAPSDVSTTIPLSEQKTNDASLAAIVPTAPQNVPALDFPTLKAGEFHTLTYAVSNDRETPRMIKSARIGGEDAPAFRVDATYCKTLALKKGEGCELEIQFRPKRPGDHTAHVEVVDNQSDSPWTVLLMGRGAEVVTAEAWLDARPNALAFAELTVGEKAPARQLTVENSSGASARNFRYGIVGENREDFVLERSCEQGWLEQSKRCELSVAFAPTAPGTRSAILSVEFYGRASPLLVRLSGMGVLPQRAR